MRSAGCIVNDIVDEKIDQRSKEQKIDLSHLEN